MLRSVFKLVHLRLYHVFLQATRGLARKISCKKHHLKAKILLPFGSFEMNFLRIRNERRPKLDLLSNQRHSRANYLQKLPNLISLSSINWKGF